MREFPLSLREQLHGGLRKDYRNVVNAPYMHKLSNAKPTDFGLVRANYVKPVISELNPEYPYPILFKGSYETLLVYEKALYLVNETDWTTSQITIYKYDDTDVEAEIKSGGNIWQFADFGNSWMLFNGKCVVFKNAYTKKVLHQRDVTIRTGCSFRGRSILAGFDSGNFWSASWRETLNSMISTKPETLSLLHSIGSNYVLWSNIGGGAGDLYWLLYNSSAIEGDFPAPVAAQGLITFNEIPNDGDNILIVGNPKPLRRGGYEDARKRGMRTIEYYRFKNLPVREKDIQIGATLAETIFNAASVIDDESTVVNASFGSRELTLTALVSGVSGNEIGISGNSSAYTFDGAYLGTLRAGASTTYFDASNPLFLEALERNEMGFAPMPFQGNILAVKELSGLSGSEAKGVMVYGDQGIAFLPAYSFDDLNTFGIESISNVGICSPGSIGGSTQEHVYLDNSGTLFRINARTLTPERLGYDEYFEAFAHPPYRESFLRGIELVVSYDSEERDYYITNNEKSYILTPHGLGETGQLITSLINVDGALVGTYDNSGERAFGFESGEFDMQYPGVKSIESLEFYGDWTEEAFACVFFRYKKQEEYRQTRWIRLNEWGTATFFITGISFKVGFKFLPDSPINIQEIVVKWKMRDLRSLRGVQAWNQP